MKKTCFFLSTALAIVSFGCASVPKDAPQEIKHAKAELDRSGTLKAKDHFPTTVANSQKDLDESITAFKESKEEGPESSGKRARSIELARNSSTLSAGANELTTNIKDWDKDIRQLNGNYSLKTLVMRVGALTSELEKSKEALAAANGQVIQSPFAKLADFRVDSPIAYFATDSAVVAESDIAMIRELASAVKGEQAFVLTVSGYADPRGSVEHNEELSRMRAENAAAVLRSNGIDSSRIKVAAMGARYARSTKDAAEVLPLDRKAVVTVTVAAPAATMPER